MATINEKLGKRIYTLRKKVGLTQDELAYQAKLDYSYMNEIEKGKRNPSVKRVYLIARALKVTLSELFDF